MKCNITNAAIFTMLICCLAFSGFSQFSSKEFTNYTTTEGLSDNKITALAQDRLGYLWIGTQQGLNRFDGLTFRQFHSEADKESLPSDEILKMKWIDSNNLAVITRQGLNILNIQLMKQNNLVIPPGPLKYPDRVNNMRDLLTDAAGNYYITTRTGFYHFNAKKELVFRYDDYSADQLASGPAGFGIFLGWLDSSNIIVTGQKGIYSYNITTRNFSAIIGAHPNFSVFAVMNGLKGINFTQRQPWAGCFILFLNYSDTAIYIDEKKKLVCYSRLSISPLINEVTWSSELCTMRDSSLFLSGKYSGFFKLNLNRASGHIYMDTIKLFNKLECNSLFMDWQGKAWVGSNSGLFAEKTNKLNIQFGKLPDTISFNNPLISTQQIITDEKYVYAASTLSGGIYVFNKKDLSYKRTVFFKLPDKVSKSLFTIIRARGDMILCGSASGLFWYHSGKNLTGSMHLPEKDTHHVGILNLFSDKNKNLWVSSSKSNGCYLIRKDDEKPEWFSFKQQLVKNIQAIYRMDEDNEGNIWMAGHGLARFNTKKWMFDLYVDSFPAFRWQQRQVSALACDEEGNVWIGNSSNGLILFDPGKMSFTSYSMADGLPDNAILALKQVDDFLWIACRNGIAKMNLKTRKIFIVVNSREVRFDRIQGNRFFYDSVSDMIYMGVGSGIIRFENKNNVYTSQSPHLIFENIIVGKDSVLWNPTGRIAVLWNKRNITLSFNAINYVDAQDQQYAYRVINGRETDWVSLKQQRSITFDNLSAGSNRIEIKVFSISNRWTPQFASIDIIIKAPFWRTWWFFLLCGFTISIIIFSLVRYRINQLKEMIGVREKLAQDLHDEVGATLSGIAMYSHLTLQQIKAEQSGKVEKSLQVIQQSAVDTVSRLSDIVWSVNPLHDSLKKLFEKLEEYTIEIAVTKNIKVNVNIPSGRIANLKLPMQTRKNIYLICKEAINNAVKYSDASILELTVKDFDQSLEFTIKDNGKGFDFNIVKRGNGLGNMQKRADEIGAKLILQSKENEGASVSLQCKIG